MENSVYKLFGILKRPENITPAELKTWWLEEHSHKVSKWPGLVRYCINLSVTDDQRYDGLAEVWFDSKESMDNVFNTSEGKVARDSAIAGSGELELITCEEFVIKDVS